MCHRNYSHSNYYFFQLPTEVQAKVRTYVAQKKRTNDAPPDIKSITVPISTFPPTAMVYNVTKPALDKLSDDDSDESKPPVDVVSAAIMAKVLEDREKERIFSKHCDTCTCHRSILMVDAETQMNAQDVFSCNECAMKYAQNIEKYSDNSKNTEKTCQNKESQNSMLHVAYHEVNENISNNKMQYQSNCTKTTSGQHLCTKDKFLSRNGKVVESVKEDGRVNVNTKASLNKKNLLCRSDLQIQSVLQNQSANTTKQTMPQKIGNTYINSKINSDKGKLVKPYKKCESQIDSTFNPNHWNKLEKKSSSHSHIVPENSNSYFDGKEQSPIDIINDRLWKNEWTKLKSQVNKKDSKNIGKVCSDIEIDIINDRVWKNNKSTEEIHLPTQLTLIEVKNIDNNSNQNDSGQMEVATSPSFSSDSIVISTSDPSSSSSDVVQSLSGLNLHNVGNSKPNSQNRITGPRNCLVRVTPGSKNILLDNAGHYKTVLYTSGCNKPNTALVHSKRLSRSGSERSISTSSEESSPILLHDNNQLQRVAEWVQSSVHMDNSVSNYTKLKPNENITNKRPLMYLTESQTKSKLFEDARRLHENTEENKCEDLVVNVHDPGEGNLNNDVNNFSSNVNNVEPEKEKDLISFDVPNEEEKDVPKPPNKTDITDFDYEVKITKEMQETYLKLAASLNHVTLNLPSTDDADLTIEKYRKDHKKLQRSLEKAGSKM